MSDEELLETYRAAINKAMDEAYARDGFATNMSRESIVAGLRAVFDTSKGETASADGWYEWLTPGMSLTRIAYVYESGRVYFPEGDDVDESDFLLAAARGNVWRLVRLPVPGTTNNESEGKA